MEVERWYARSRDGKGKDGQADARVQGNGISIDVVGGRKSDTGYERHEEINVTKAAMVDAMLKATRSRRVSRGDRGVPQSRPQSRSQSR